MGWRERETDRDIEREMAYRILREEVWEQESDCITISPHIYFVTLESFISEPIPFMKAFFFIIDVFHESLLN